MKQQAEVSKKVLFLFTEEYPYGTHESYLENEIGILSEKFHQICILPRQTAKPLTRTIPSNAEVLLVNGQFRTSPVLFKHLFFILAVLVREFRKTSKKKFFISNIREWNSMLCQCIHLASQVKDLIAQKAGGRPVVLYSYWMNDWALSCAVMKRKGWAGKFVFRVLGYDIYDERRKGGYMPFRYFIFSQVSKVFCVSQDAARYLKAKNIFPEKIVHSYFGTADLGINAGPASDSFVIYSCSNIIPLKRLHLIVEILRHVQFDVLWVHRGDGEGKEDLLQRIAGLPSNIRMELLPRENDYSRVLQHLRQMRVNLFVNVSETEGLPVTLIEAISLGIPVLATNVGGTAEVVTAETGILIDRDFEPSEVAGIIAEFRSGNKNTGAFRAGVRQFWEKHFRAEHNYERFSKELLDF